LRAPLGKAYFIAIAIFIGCFSKAQGNAKATPLSDSEKQELIALENSVGKDPKREALESFRLAILYQRDQELEKALRTFMASLELLKMEEGGSVATKEELFFYDEALEIYLNPPNHDVIFASELIIERYAPLIKENPSYHKLGFIVASAYANRGDFLAFFELFYNSYLYLPNDFFAHKTLAILHIKLLEKMLPHEKKEERYAKITAHLNEATRANILDYSLYKLMILYSSEENKAQTTTKALQAVIDRDLYIPRTDLPFFIQCGFEFCSLSQLKLFIDQQQKHHEYSRILTSAKEEILLKQKEIVCQNPAH